MAIERRNSFHLMLSDDELALLRMLAEQEGLNASDYLRSLMRRVAAGAGAPATNISRVLELVHLLAPEIDATKLWTGQPVPPNKPPKRASAKKKKTGT